jgi:hypothetical protein
MARQVKEKSVSARTDMMRTLLTPLMCGTICKKGQPRISHIWALESYSLHGQIPVFIHECLVSDCKKRDLPGLDRGRGWVNREQLDV